jgi:hypothetical protein
MQIKLDPQFPYPTLFLIAGRAAGAAVPPVEPVGFLVVKQTVQLNGSIAEQEDILLTDVQYAPDLRGDKDLELRLETDLYPYKPNLDVVAIRDSYEPGDFGNVRLNRGNGFSPWLPLPYGWRTRGQQEEDEPARIDEAGDDLVSFRPADTSDPSNPPGLLEVVNLPSGFRNSFFNGGHLSGLAHLKAGDIVEYNDGLTTRRVVIPTGPNLTITKDDQPILPTVAIDLNVDTVVYDVPASHFLITWRAVFTWEDRIAAATLEVS